MVFSSLTFIYIFLPICLILYFATRSIQQKNTVLLLMSLIFYAWGEPKWILLMLISTLVEYVGARVIDKKRETNPKLAKVALFTSVFVALGFLFVFKYYDFFITNLNVVLGCEIRLLSLTLPIGISFYTFQTITYIVDVYRNKVPVQTSFTKLLLYVSMFPQLIAGPIVKYSDIQAQIECRSFSGENAGQGVLRFAVGLTKKAIFANIAGEIATQFLDGNLSFLSVAGAWMGILAYTLQIYFDFSAYSDMAIGLGKIFGFDYPENFNYPYIARSINDFWKRWHITLTTFFREYLYIPLGGNKNHHVLNLFLVWAFTGLWHGSEWNFILWGFYYYVLIVCEKLFIGRILSKLPALISHIYTLFLVVIGWVFFYFDDLERLKTFFYILLGFSDNPTVEITDSAAFINHLAFFVVSILAITPISKYIKTLFFKLANKNKFLNYISSFVLIVFVVVLLGVNTAAIMGSTYNPFLYFRF